MGHEAGGTREERGKFDRNCYKCGFLIQGQAGIDKRYGSCPSCHAVIQFNLYKVPLDVGCKVDRCLKCWRIKLDCQDYCESCGKTSEVTRAEALKALEVLQGCAHLLREKLDDAKGKLQQCARKRTAASVVGAKRRKLDGRDTTGDDEDESSDEENRDVTQEVGQARSVNAMNGRAAVGSPSSSSTIGNRAPLTERALLPPNNDDDEGNDVEGSKNENGTGNPVLPGGWTLGDLQNAVKDDDDGGDAEDDNLFAF